jgi:hypothetical protein
VGALPPAEGTARMSAMPKDPNTSSSSNGASSNGAAPDLVASEAFIAAQQARFAEVHAELVAEGVDSTKELAALRAAAATWPE